MKRITIICVALSLFAVLAAAQAPEAPKPAPELERLNYFSGSWTSEGDLKPSPWGPGGKFTSKGHAEWMSGKFFLVSHGNFSGAMGSGTEMAVMGYKPDDKVYTYDAYNSMGEAEHSTGTISGDTWIWMGENKMGGKTFHGRFTIKELTPTSYSFKYEMQPEGGDWSTVMEGTSTKAGGKTATAGKEKEKEKKEGKKDKDKD